MHFKRLRLVGFKSFVDATEIAIEPGLTGIVGPNGCGKSNIVEALRWVMGESSAKQMRGGEMDDVIFAGTSARPSRNLAEVALGLDNGRRTAPAIFNGSDEIEVSRRINRGHGSVYRVNGREARARDVQLMFADASTGARSTAIVSQGQIGAFIAARPQQRRALLEEAAGIGGLHARRHEAELRLRAAEQNLERLDDVLVTLRGQRQALGRQARQAERYRALSEQIRQAEARVMLARWHAAEAAVAAAEAAYTDSERVLEDAARAAATATKEQAQAAEALPEARRAESAAAAALQRLVVERERIEGEIGRLAAEREAVARRLTQAEEDLGRERARAADAEAQAERVERDRAALATEAAEETFDREAAEADVAEAAERVRELETRVTAETSRLAAKDAERVAARRRADEAAARAERLARDLEQVRRDADAARDAAPPADALEAATAEAGEAERRAGAELAAAREAEGELGRWREAEGEARRRLQGWHDAVLRLRTEQKTLSDLLAGGEAELWPPIVDSLTVTPGYEAALGAALGDDLDAALAESAPVRWEARAPAAPLPPLPEGARPLAEVVRAPDVLAARLSQIGVVASEAEGRDLASRLACGQRLVDRTGTLWRWDGFTMTAGAGNPAARRLEQRNRLKKIADDLAVAERGMAEVERELERVRERIAAADARRRTARDAEGQARRRHGEAKDRAARLGQQAAVLESKLQGLAQTEARLAEDLRTAEEERETAAAAVAAAQTGVSDRAELDVLRGELAGARDRAASVKAMLERHDREVEARQRRLRALEEEAQSWAGRVQEAARQEARLAERVATERAALDELESRPSHLDADLAELAGRIEMAETARRGAADALASAESLAAERDRAAREAEARVAEAREARVRAEGGVTQARQARDQVAERIRERLDAAPNALARIAGIEDGATEPGEPVEALERRLEALARDRDALGTVNLRAGEELRDVEGRITGIETEREDLTRAIAKLRRAIQELNREGRERLLAAFETVNGHFRDLFERLFGGGEAHLVLVESDDPLEAGLDIMASPPGKKLQSLGLLSGGERALTALALMFGVFLTNPAPICVLDEVDAPLDDANVDRFCRLVEEISGRTETRFLCVTHHRLTMARMDRLYGVTMPERGVSRMVSVDLREAEALRATG